MADAETHQDIYAFFNIQRNATNEDITNAYRRLSKIYHPDKHGDADLKKQAEELFNKTRKFYDILIDPQKRAIYDTIGDNLLSPDGAGSWDVVERKMSPNEIREEYERLMKAREEQLLQQRTNPSGTVKITIDACNLFRNFEDEYDYDEDLDFFVNVRMPEIKSMSIAQSVEAPASLNDRIIVGGSLSSENGVGSGGLALTWRRLLGPSMWAETEFGVGDNVAISCKLFRTFSSKTYGSCQIISQITSEGIRPGFVLGLHRQLEKHWTGSISAKVGLQQSVTTSLSFDDSRDKRMVLALVVGRPASFVLLSASKKFNSNDARVNASLRVGTFGVITEFGYERRVSKHSTAGCSCRMHFPKGLVVKLKWTRASQTYLINVILCDEEILAGAFVYGVLTPVLAYNIVKWCIKPYLDRKRERENAERMEKEMSTLDSKRKEAELSVKLMKSAAARSRDVEIARNGLIVVQAFYGKVGTSAAGGDALNSPDASKTIDVQVPLQAMVKDSKLTLYESPKWHLAGFYDPCFGESKYLRIVYKYSGVAHEIIVGDDEFVTIPQHSHRLNLDITEEREDED